MNGVEFHSLYNGGYALTKPSSNKDNLDEVVDIDLPDVPPAVTRKSNLQEQMEEMRLWFKAFKEQDYSLRDYRKYFKPNLCYLEGAWYLNHQTINEPETSEKHFHDTDKWYSDMDLTRFQAYDGHRSQRENFDYMPTLLYNMSENKIPQFAHWKSRVLCQPISQDVPTVLFKVCVLA
ncbi:hypothetical protein PoB_006907200 [Plakobranchus ocellatus]|uniref:Decapping nuclease n=1 Tax=Plakobranchus ocellatus TaxID=259542 RepID=A0AAV4DE99_9GAST|nr:hypothetical protein PoB_006907200 [Plakobranchus ocellatus]